MALAEAGLKPIVLRPKEALAVMNGTAVMTGLAVLAFKRAEWLSLLSCRLSAMATLALLGNVAHFDARLAEAKPHPGQMKATARIRTDLAAYAAGSAPNRLQDRYSIRCSPHVIGVLEDMLPTFRVLIETETNSANDNPLFDPTDGRPLHGGHFYGGHIAFAMDGLKTLVANVADLLDRQLALLVDTRYNNGLPEKSVGRDRPSRRYQPRSESGADRGVGLDGGGAQIDDAGKRLLALHRVSQSGQGVHGNHRSTRRFAYPRTL